VSKSHKKEVAAEDEKAREERLRQQAQALTDMSAFLLLLDGARQFGLMEINFKIDVDKCEEFITAAAKKGISPQIGRIQPFASDLVHTMTHCQHKAAVHERITTEASK
jgi:hypothetical protein